MKKCQETGRILDAMGMCRWHLPTEKKLDEISVRLEIFYRKLSAELAQQTGVSEPSARRDAAFGNRTTVVRTQYDKDREESLNFVNWYYHGENEACPKIHNNHTNTLRWQPLGIWNVKLGRT